MQGRGKKGENFTYHLWLNAKGKNVWFIVFSSKLSKWPPINSRFSCLDKWLFCTIIINYWCRLCGQNMSKIKFFSFLSFLFLHLKRRLFVQVPLFSFLFISFPQLYWKIHKYKHDFQKMLDYDCWKYNVEYKMKNINCTDGANTSQLKH